MIIDDVLSFFLLLSVNVALSYGLAVLTANLINRVKLRYSIKKPLDKALLIVVLAPIFFYGANSNLYTKQSYIQKAHKILNIAPRDGRYIAFYRYYNDSAETCNLKSNDKYSSDFTFLRSFGQQKYIVVISGEYVVFDRFGRQIKKLKSSTPLNNCGGY